MLRKVYFIILLSLTLACTGSSWANPGNQATPVTTAAITRDTVIITEEAMGWIEAKVNPTV
ncbi:MAG TPA: hypothetical protein EYP64_07025, partial [Desulfarculaceae bacterium]|nr:hypothetical protein [Desulfarculaceae bacterium]